MRVPNASRLAAKAMLVVPILAGAMLLSPVAAQAADQKVTITVAPRAVLLDPTLVRIFVTITCHVPPDNDQGRAQLHQAIPGGIAYGDGGPETPNVCDGKAHDTSYLVWADTASPGGFRRGTATALVSITTCGNGPDGFVCESGNSGYVVVRLRRA